MGGVVAASALGDGHAVGHLVVVDALLRGHHRRPSADAIGEVERPVVSVVVRLLLRGEDDLLGVLAGHLEQRGVVVLQTVLFEVDDGLCGVLGRGPVALVEGEAHLQGQGGSLAGAATLCGHGVDVGYHSGQLVLDILVHIGLRGAWHLSLLRRGVVVDDGHCAIAVGHHEIAVGTDEAALGYHVLLHSLRREGGLVDIGQQRVAAADGLEVVEVHVASTPSRVGSGAGVGGCHGAVADGREALPGEVVVAEVGSGVPVNQGDGRLEEVVAAGEELVDVALGLPSLRVGEGVVWHSVEEVAAGGEREREHGQSCKDVLLIIFHFGYACCLESDVESEGVGADERIAGATLAGGLGVEFEVEGVDGEEVLGAVVDAHVLQTDAAYDVLGDGVAKLQGLQAQVAGVPKPEVGHGDTHVACAGCSLEHARHLGVVVVLCPSIAPVGGGMAGIA